MRDCEQCLRETMARIEAFQDGQWKVIMLSVIGGAILAAGIVGVFG